MATPYDDPRFRIGAPAGETQGPPAPNGDANGDANGGTTIPMENRALALGIGAAAIVLAVTLGRR